MTRIIAAIIVCLTTLVPNFSTAHGRAVGARTAPLHPSSAGGKTGGDEGRSFFALAHNPSLTPGTGLAAGTAPLLGIRAQPQAKAAVSKPGTKPKTPAKTIAAISVVQAPTTGQPVRIQLILSRSCDVTLSIMPHVTDGRGHDPFGWPGRIARVLRAQAASPGTLQVRWDGKDDAGRDVLSPSPCITIKASAGTDRASICFRPISQPTAQQTLTLIHQQSGSVFAPGEAVEIAAQVTNVAERTAKVAAAVSPSGQGILAQASTAVEPCPNGAATVVLQLGSTSTPGTRKITASLSIGGSRVATASTSVTVLAPAPLPRSAEPIFGLMGLANPALAQAVGAGLWVGGRLWWDNAELRGPSQPVPDAPDAVVADANKRGILLIGSAQPASEPPDALRTSVSHFIRRVAGWLLPPDWAWSGDPRPYGDVKQVHKDALVVSGVLSPEEARSVAEKDTPADALLFRGESDSAPPESLLAARDASAPGKELWALLGGPSPIRASEALRGAVLNLVGGADRVFWFGAGGLVAADGSVGPGLAGCAFASQLLTGAEYAGRLRANAGLQAHVFRKGGRGFAVAWCESGATSIEIPSEAGKTLVVRNADGSKASDVVRGAKVTLKAAPVVIEGVALSAVRSALTDELASRAQVAAALAADRGIPCPPAHDLRSPERLADVRTAAVEAYASNPDARLRTVSLLCKLERAVDSAVLLQAISAQSSDTTARRALDAANHAIADLRAPIVLKEGPKGYLPHARVLLRQAEKRMSAALTAYKQQDYALATAKANQVTSLAKALVTLVAAEPVWDLSEVR